jgi:hypothetical protein
MWLKEREDLPNQPAKESTEHRRQSKYLSRPKSFFLRDGEAFLCSVAALGKKIVQILRKKGKGGRCPSAKFLKRIF